MAKTSLQSALEAADMAAHAISSAVVMKRASWLHLSGLCKEVQTTMEDLPF